jgi:hypothetical protein
MNDFDINAVQLSCDFFLMFTIYLLFAIFYCITPQLCLIYLMASIFLGSYENSFKFNSHKQVIEILLRLCCYSNLFHALLMTILLNANVIFETFKEKFVY